jgi:transcriptional regulator with XRE-family HTH domain
MMAPDVAGDLASFGTLLRRYRVVAGLSQEELAQRAHMSARGISDLERGVRRAPYRGTVMQLAEALELTGDEREILEQAAGRQRVPGPSSRPVESRPDEPLLAIKLAVPAL